MFRNILVFERRLKTGDLSRWHFRDTGCEEVVELGKAEQTLVPIAAGGRLVHRLFDNQPGLKLDSNNIPSV